MIIHGNALNVPLADESVDTIITDPPYGLSSGPTKYIGEGGAGFMGKAWDHGVPGPEFWREALRVAKPGAFLLAFGGTRTYHRLTCAIEDAGWIIRDCMSWLYGSGFPKSHDISKGIDRAKGAESEVVGPNPHARPIDGNGSGYTGPTGHDPNITAPATPLAQQWDGYGTALKPAWEPIIVAMKPLDGTFAHNAEVHGVAGLWIDGGRIGTDGGEKRGERRGEKRNGTSFDVRNWQSLKLNKGRWPANVILDEEAGAMLDAQSGESVSRVGAPRRSAKPGDGYGMTHTGSEYNDSGGASRFFYCAKASRKERNAGLDDRRNAHPTVKPVSLMRYLAKLTRTPTGGLVLDPFCGSGTTGVACALEGRDFVGIELNPEYCEIARRRIAHAKGEEAPEPGSTCARTVGT